MGDLNELALMIAKEAAEKLVRIPEIDAVCVTLVSKSNDVPLGLSVVHPEQTGRATTTRAISKLSAHIDVLTQALLEEEQSHGRTVDGQDGEGVGEQGQAQPLADGSD